VTCLSPAALAADLAVRDLTDPATGPHALQLLVDAILQAASTRWPDASLIVHRGSRVVSVADNYDHLGYAASAKARDSRYARYVSRDRMLRSQTSALIPGALRGLTGTDALIACPGVVYRRDSIDRLHTGTPHQLDLWRVGPGDLLELVGLAVRAALPGVPWRTKPASHPYTTGGLEIEALGPGGAWVEVGECGLAAGHVLRAAGLPAGTGGLALGLGLDRLLMLRKGIDDIRLLRSADRRVAAQLTDLTPYRPVSAQPAAHRDLSVALPADVTPEDLGDRVRDLLGDDALLVEEVTILSVTPPGALPPASRERLGLRDDEANVLVRVVLRDLHATLPRRRANALRDRLWAGLMGDRTPPRHVGAAAAPIGQAVMTDA
jgi:phenylalanyl-tRNA synthetase alpha chain